nr:MAG TPA: hypothetical protein [Bacteriophage sp.]
MQTQLIILKQAIMLYGMAVNGTTSAEPLIFQTIYRKAEVKPQHQHRMVAVMSTLSKMAQR